MNTSNKRQAIIQWVNAKIRRQSAAAEAFGISIRQVKRLCRAARQPCVTRLPSARRGQPAKNRITDAVNQTIIQLAQTTYAGVGPTFMAEK